MLCKSQGRLIMTRGIELDKGIFEKNNFSSKFMGPKWSSLWQVITKNDILSQKLKNIFPHKTESDGIKIESYFWR
jgi:hypothetical protein